MHCSVLPKACFGWGYWVKWQERPPTTHMGKLSWGRLCQLIRAIAHIKGFDSTAIPHQRHIGTERMGGGAYHV